jgi:hypothetical protein
LKHQFPGGLLFSYSKHKTKNNTAEKREKETNLCVAVAAVVVCHFGIDSRQIIMHTKHVAATTAADATPNRCMFYFTRYDRLQQHSQLAAHSLISIQSF